MRRQIDIKERSGKTIEELKTNAIYANTYRIFSPDENPTEASLFYVLQYDAKGNLEHTTLFTERDIVEFNAVNQIKLFPIPEGSSISYTWKQS